MSARYILRLDGACSTMDKKKWDRIENICDKFNIKPIIEVIPYNEDESMKIDKYDENFLDKIKNWQKKDGILLYMDIIMYMFLTNSVFCHLISSLNLQGWIIKFRKKKLKKDGKFFKKKI